jgi:Phage integrase, N-terminal SAM-like domain
MNRYNKTGEAVVPPLQSIRLLDQIRERIRYLHYSLQTEKVYLYWARFFIRWHCRAGQMRHPREMGKAEVEAFPTMLTTSHKRRANLEFMLTQSKS